MPTLPVDHILPILLTAFRDAGHAVLQAPPHHGDPMIADMDFTHANIPVGQLIHDSTVTLNDRLTKI